MFVALFYLKMIVFVPRSKSDTFWPKRHPCLGFCAISPTINDWTVLKSVPKSISKFVPKYVPYRCARSHMSLLCSELWRTPLLILKIGGYAISEVVGALVREAILRHRLLGRFRGQIPRTPPFLAYSCNHFGVPC
jgi:hypothetical protein